MKKRIHHDGGQDRHSNLKIIIILGTRFVYIKEGGGRGKVGDMNKMEVE